MHGISEELDQVMDRLDSETARLLEQAVRNAVALANKSAATNGKTDEMGYPLNYFDDTSGSFENEPLDRPADLPYENREPW